MTEPLAFMPNESWDPNSNENERVGAELMRLWESEVRDYFKAEGEFLKRHGREMGYGEDYIAQILEDHRRIESLVREGGRENVRLFSKMLIGHFRFKEEFNIRHLERVMDSADASSPSEDA